jgi:hypothetical protein
MPKVAMQKLTHYWNWINTNSLQKPLAAWHKSVKHVSYVGSTRPTGDIVRINCIGKGLGCSHNWAAAH